MRSYTFLLIVVFLCVLPAAFGQRKLLSGSVVDSTTSQGVRLATIQNITTGKLVNSRSNGTFELDAAIGHLIAYQANGYYGDTLSVSVQNVEGNFLLLILRSLPATLTDVTITGRYNAYQIDSMERRRNFMEDVGDQIRPAVSRTNDLGFGVGINLDRWSSKQKERRKARSIFELMEEEAYINYRWNEELVSEYVTYEDDKLYDFMNRNRPTVSWLRKNAYQEALVYYINAALKKEKRKN